MAKKITITHLNEAKTQLEAGKTLKEIKDALGLTLNVQELNKAMVERFGSVNIGNPYLEGMFKQRAKSLLDNALKNMKKADVKAAMQVMIDAL